MILGFLSIFKKCQASSHFEALNSVCLSSYQSGVIPPIQMRRRTKAFFRVSTGDSDIPSSCEMKNEPEFKTLQGNPAFFWVRSFAVHSTWDRKHRVTLTYLLLRENSTWGAGEKLAQILNQRQIISSHLGAIWGAWSFPRVAVLILIFISTWDGCLRETLSIPQGNQATCTVCCLTRDSSGANDGKWASSCVDFSYTDLFCIPELTSKFISSCDSVLGDSLVFYQENRGSLRV